MAKDDSYTPKPTIVEPAADPAPVEVAEEEVKVINDENQPVEDPSAVPPTE